MSRQSLRQYAERQAEAARETTGVSRVAARPHAQIHLEHLRLRAKMKRALAAEALAEAERFELLADQLEAGRK